MKWLRTIQIFFGFSKREAKATIILIPLMLVIVFSEPIYEWWWASRPLNFSEHIHVLDSLVELRDSEVTKSEIKPLKLYPFDPNTITVDELIELGFSKYIAQRINNYRVSGGRFIIKNDLLKIYGLDSAFFDKISPWITLPDQYTKPARTFNAKHSKNNDSSIPDFKEIEPFDVNRSDAIMLSRIRGIGSVLSGRIIKYRDMLGGFLSLDQLHEVYGLDSSVVVRLKAHCFVDENFRPKRLNINAHSEAQLRMHPYINHRIARAITNYKFQHGDYDSVGALSNVLLINPEELVRIRPYLTTDFEK